MSRPYRLDAPAARIARALGADAGEDAWQGGRVEAGGYAPVVIGGPGGRRYLVPRQWGVPPPPRGEHVVTHVRNLASPFWIGTLRHTQFRCLVPATGFLGADGRGTDGKMREIVAFAGIWRDSEVPSFAILSGGAAPVIVAPEDYGVWLNAEWKLARRVAMAADAPE